MSTSRIRTRASVSIYITVLALAVFLVVITSRPFEFKTDVILFFSGFLILILYGFISMVYGTYVSLDKGTLSRIDNFFFKKSVHVDDLDVIRYQPSYGIGKEISSLYFFKRNNNLIIFTLTSIWFKEEALGKLLQDLIRINPRITLDVEAEELRKKYAN